MENVQGVHKAINAIQSALAKEGIGKGRKNQAQGYSFRGIDDMYNVMSPHLSEHGLVVIPNYSDRQVVERENAKGTALFYVTLKGEFTFLAADGSSLKATTFGEAMDSGDKATNKAMSAALKYALMQTFTIPTEGDNDSENQTHEVVHAALRPGDGTGKIRPASGFFEAQTVDMQNHLLDIARRVTALHKKGDIAGATDEWISSKKDLDAEQLAAAWDQMESNVRTAIKREGTSRDKQKEAA